MVCRKHGEGQPCYVVCEHIVKGEAKVYLTEAPDEHPGLLLCEECDRKMPRPL